MNSFKTVFKVQLKNYFAFDKAKLKNKKTIAIAIALFACFVPMIVMLCTGVYSITVLMAEQNLLPEMFSMIFTSSQILVFFFGLGAFISVLYFSKDNTFLKSLPVSSSAIYFAKMAIVYLNELIISTLIILPVGVIFIVSCLVNAIAVSPLFYILLPFAILLMPLVPILFVSIFSYPLMLMVRALKKKPVLAGMLSLLAFLVVMTGYMLLVNGLTTKASSDAGAVMDMSSIGVYLKSLSKIGFMGTFFAKAMFNQSFFLNIFLFLSVTAVMVTISIFISKYTYSKASVFSQESGGTQKAKANNKIKVNSTVVALIKKDIKCVTREVSLMMNSLIGMIMTPMFMFVFAGMFNTKSLVSEETVKINSELMSMGMCVFFLILMLNGTNYLAVIGLSREGANVRLLKSLCVESSQIVKAKLILSDIPIYVGCLSSAIVLIFAGVGILNVVLFAVSTTMFGIAFNGYSLGRDFKNPKLDWLNYNQLLKRNFSAMIPMFVAMGIGAVIMIPFMMLAALIKSEILSSILAWGIMLLISIILYFVWRKPLYAKATQCFDNIEI